MYVFKKRIRIVTHAQGAMFLLKECFSIVGNGDECLVNISFVTGGGCQGHL